MDRSAAPNRLHSGPTARHSRLQRLLPILTFLLLSLFVPLHADDSNKIKIDPEARGHYLSLAAGVQPARLSSTITALSKISYPLPSLPGEAPVRANSHMAGTPGGDQAAAYVKAQLSTILGANHVSTEMFNATVPEDNGAALTEGGHVYTLRPLWPNLVRTSTLPVTGVDGPLIYAGRGDLRSFRGKDVEGSIVLMDFNSGTQWLNAPRLGAKAVIFIEPTQTMRGEAESKFIGIPVAIPRFWISRRDAALLQSTALTTPNIKVHVACNNPWISHQVPNIIGVLPGSDPVLSKQVVVVEAYYDSMSVVPTLAPGAESACSVAAMLEMARAFKADPPKRTVWFLACGAHFLGMQGVRTFIDQHMDDWQQISALDRFKHWVSGGRTPLPERTNVLLFSSLDLSSQNNSIGVFYKGYFYDYREDIQSDFSDIGRTLRENAAKIGQVLGFDSTSVFADGINPINGKGWRNYLPGRFAFDSEAATMAGGRGITFATTDDSRQRVDTPADTPDTINIANLTQQTRLLVAEYWHLFNDTNDPNAVSPDSPKSVMPVTDWPAWTRQGLRLGYSRVSGRALLFDPKANFVPDKPIAGTLAVIGNPSKTMTGVRGNLIQATDPGTNPSRPDARFEFVGLPLVISNGTGLRFPTANNIQLNAYHLHAQDDAQGNRGDIDFAPDQGVNGAANYPTAFDLTSAEKQTQVIVFPCVATSIYDLIDQEALKSLTGVTILDGTTDSDPREYGFILAGSEPGVSYVEDVAVLFSMPDPTTRLKVIMNSGPGAVRFLLINSQQPLPTLSNTQNQRRAQGIGYAVGIPSARVANFTTPPDPSNPDDIVRNGAITNTSLRVAQDMWNLDDFRITNLAKFRIINEELTNGGNALKKPGLHDIAKEYIDKALAAYAVKDYDAFDAFSREAWAYEAKVYPQAQSTANDVVQGVIFYLFLLIPFAYFLERLLFSYSDLRRQLSAVFVIFLVIFLIFSQIHPAFSIGSVNPAIILIAFVMLALSVIVSLLVWGKFEEQLKKFSQTVSGTHKAEVGKASIAFAAFALGISNMRRRKERTWLTCITLILLTFTVLSFTSIVNTIRYNDVPAPGESTYSGLLLRMPTWDSLQEPAYRLLNDEYGRKYSIAPRAWFYGTDQGQQTFLHLKRADLGTDVKGVAGYTPEEANVTHMDKALLIGTDGKPVGRWFRAGDTFDAIIPKQVADQLNISPADVARGVTIDFSGIPYTVIGIIDPDTFKGIKDLDNETLSPVDFISMSSQGQTSQGQAAAQKGFQEYLHLDPNNVLYVPYRTLINMGGNLRSIAIDFGDAQTTHQQLLSLMPRLDLNLYAGGFRMVGDKVVPASQNHRFSAIGATASTGLVNIIIPVLIAALIVLNTMLGSVFERVKEIAIFSSIGLSPSNVAMLFIAEALVYAIIGAVSGYLIGQILSKILSVTGLLSGLSLNFSSTSAELSIGLVISVVLLSTIFPARKASEVATPSVDRTWRVPDPEGDVWRITLPFAVTGAQAKGINGFLAEWFRAYEEQSVGDFLTQGITSGIVDMEGGSGYRLTGRIWLAPFDLGVSQDLQLDTAPTDLEDVYAVNVILTRISGDVSNWKRVNRRFLNVLRKQFLIWRTLSAEQRERYLSEPEEQSAEAVAAGSATVAPAL